MARGGRRVGAGRKPMPKELKLRRINVDEIMHKVGTGPDKMPLAFLLAVMHAPEAADIKMSERIQCAIAAAPYCHAKLATKDQKDDARSTMQTQSDLAAALRDLARIARLRESSPAIDADILEPATAPDKMSGRIDEADKMSAIDHEPDEMSAGQNVRTPDKMSASDDDQEEREE